MHAAHDDRADGAPAALPVIGGARWFGPEPRPFLLRIELPLSTEEMVAALYSVAQPGEIASDEELVGSVAVTVLLEGLPAVEARAAQLLTAEQCGAVESDFLAMCRLRIAALLALPGS